MVNEPADWWTARAALRHLRPIGDIDVAFADVDGDGRRDLIQVAPSLLRVSRATKSGYRRIFEARLSAAVAVAAGDVDGDGRADVYIASGDDDRISKDLLLLSQARRARLHLGPHPPDDGGPG